MKYEDLQNKNLDELQEVTKEMRIKLGKFRFELANNTLKNYSQIKKMKKDIARALTAMQGLNK